MSTFSEYFGGGSSGGGIGGWVMPILVSKSLPAFTVAGKLRIAIHGAGGSGAASTLGGTGGNSAPWGVKVVNIAVGDVVAITLGASTKTATLPSNGVQGGSSVVTLNGSTILTAQGGEGGQFANAAGTFNGQNPTAIVVGADWYVPGIRAGQVITNGANFTLSGGSAVDVLQTGLGRSPNVTGGNAVGAGGSVGNNTSANPKGWIAIANFGFAFGAGTNYGDPGKGAGNSPPQPAGDFAGGAANSGGMDSQGGIGGGGGAGNSIANSGFGGNGYAYLTFQPLE